MAIKYGYFNAVKTGEVYDRTYNNEDLNNFLRGVINQNGVFCNVGDKFKIQIVDGLTLSVGTGKAIVNGHWVEIDGTAQVITLDPAESYAPRWDMISLRWDDNDRTITLEVTKGVGDVTNPEKPQPLGFIDSTVITYGNKNRVILGNWDEDASVTEICLAYIYVPMSATTIVPKNIEYNVGNDSCPWISHLIMGPGVEDIDSYLAGFRVSFEEWFEQLQEDLTINTKVQSGKKLIKPTTTSISIRTVAIDMEGYIYSEGDLINVYLNGRRMIEGYEYDIMLAGGTAYVNNLRMSSNLNVGETLEIEAIKGVAFDIPDGNDVLY